MEKPQHDISSPDNSPSDLLGKVDEHDLRMLGWRLELYSELAHDSGIPYSDLLELRGHIDSLPGAARDHYSPYVESFTRAMNIRLEQPDIFADTNSPFQAKIAASIHTAARSLRFRELIPQLFVGKPKTEEIDMMKAELEQMVSRGLLRRSNRLSYYLPGMYGSKPYKSPPDTQSTSPAISEREQPPEPTLDDKILRSIGSRATARQSSDGLPGASINRRTARRGGQSNRRR